MPSRFTPERRSNALFCADCQKAMFRSKSSLEQGKARCQPCRRALPMVRKTGRTPCVTCEAPSWGDRCRRCEDKRRNNGVTPAEVLANRRALLARRRAREAAAPGLTAQERRNLRALWIRQRRRCTYCVSAYATQLDHVIPLALGGTNREGNLAPACTACNQAKSDNLLIAWRNGKKPRRMRWNRAS